MPKKRVFKIIFYNQGEIFELYAESVSQGNLYGFVEIEGLLFGERSQVVVDPSEERLKKEFSEVQRIFLPMYAIIRIDEVEKEGVPRITRQPEGGDNVRVFPGPAFTPRAPHGGTDKP